MNELGGTLARVLRQLVSPLIGKGLVDRYAPFLIRGFQSVYARLQGDGIADVGIPLGCELGVFKTDLGVGLPLLMNGTYEPLQTRLFLASLHEGESVWDVGANVGYYTVLASRAVGPKGRVVAFEPDRDNLALLKENTGRNGCSNVAIRDTAVSDRDGTTTFNSELFNKGESALSLGGDVGSSGTVPTVTLDTFSVRDDVPCPSVIKMDIEGAEVLALRGATKTFHRCENLRLFIEYNPSSIARLGERPEMLLSLLNQLGFDPKQIIDEARERISPYSPQQLARTMRYATYCTLVCEKSAR